MFQVIVLALYIETKTRNFSNYGAIVIQQIMKEISQTYSELKKKYFERNSELSLVAHTKK